MERISLELMDLSRVGLPAPEGLSEGAGIGTDTPVRYTGAFCQLQNVSLMSLILCRVGMPGPERLSGGARRQYQLLLLLLLRTTQNGHNAWLTHDVDTTKAEKIIGGPLALQNAVLWRAGLHQHFLAACIRQHASRWFLDCCCCWQRCHCATLHKVAFRTIVVKLKLQP